MRRAQLCDTKLSPRKQACTAVYWLLTTCKVSSAQGPFLAGYEAVRDGPGRSYGLRRLDHAVGNVPRLLEVVDYMAAFTGFHEFAEFTAEVRRRQLQARACICRDRRAGRNKAMTMCVS